MSTTTSQDKKGETEDKKTSKSLGGAKMSDVQEQYNKKGSSVLS